MFVPGRGQLFATFVQRHVLEECTCSAAQTLCSAVATARAFLWSSRLGEPALSMFSKPVAMGLYYLSVATRRNAQLRRLGQGAGQKAPCD